MRVEHILPEELVRNRPLRVLVVGAGGPAAPLLWDCRTSTRQCACGAIASV